MTYIIARWRSADKKWHVSTSNGVILGEARWLRGKSGIIWRANVPVQREWELVNGVVITVAPRPLMAAREASQCQTAVTRFINVVNLVIQSLRDG